MAEIDCDTWHFGAPECTDEPPPEFIRAPPRFLCEMAFSDEYTCGNDSPFPFHINADGVASGETTFLAVALVCAVIFTVLVTTSSVFLWRNRKHLRKYLTCRSRSPTESRKGTTSSAASTSDGSCDSTAYTDNIEYKKKALLAAISPPSGVKFLTDNAIRYAPNQAVSDGHQPGHPQHIYEEIRYTEEIAQNYPFCPAPARYAVFRDLSGTPLSQQAFAQRQSWLDLLQRPPCPDMAFNLYQDGSQAAAACPNCYYPSLPRDSTRNLTSEQQARITVNPAEMFDVHSGQRRNRRHGAGGMAAPYPQHRGLLDSDHYQTTQALMNSTVIRNEFPSSHRSLHHSHHTGSMDTRTRTLESSCPRQPRRHKRAKCTNRPHPMLQTFSVDHQHFNMPDSLTEQSEMFASHGPNECV